MFSLEEISKIRGAKESQEVMKFFSVLDKHIKDMGEIIDLEHKLTIATREDTIRKSSKKEKEIITWNSPNTQNKHIKI